ncbi:MAG: transglutaminase domain-containing protein [Clostridia bacterium]|nr:transglutaminase domain-containing protein [Clostridia bacterium]
MKENRLIPQLRRESLLFVLGFFFAFGLAMLTSEIFRLPISLGANLLWTLVTLLVLSVAFFNQTTTLVTLAALILAVLFFFLAPIVAADWFTERSEPLLDKLTAAFAVGKRFIEEGFGFFNTDLTASEELSFALLGRLVLTVQTTLSFLLIQKLRTYWVPVLLLIFLLPMTIYSGALTAYVWLVPVALVSIGMILLSSGHLLDLLRKKHGGRHLLAAASQMAVALILAVAIAFVAVNKLDYQRMYSPYWQGIVDDLVTLLPEAFQPQLTISPFSLGDDGYYPLGNRLGGPVVLKDNEVALIEGDAPSLLKVQSSDYYDGLRWQRLLNNPNFRYSSPFNGGAESQVFNPYVDKNFFALLPNDAASKIYENYSYEITPLRQGTQLLFVSGTPTDLVSSREEAMLFYFNQAGVVYARTIFDNNHSYKITSYDVAPQALGLAVKPSTAGLSPAALDKAVSQFTEMDYTLENRGNAFGHYLQLPDLDAYKEGGLVYETTLSLTDEATGEYAKAAALLSYFNQNPDFAYDMNVPAPPENVDFVEYFLQQKTGYCTYYASALTLMARLSGIPARYIEGYALSSDNRADLAKGDETYLNSINAHAWTELYLNGIGWVPVDPTPGGLNGEGVLDPNVTPTPTPTPTPPPTTTPEATEPTTAPSETSSGETTSPTTVITEPVEEPDDVLNGIGKILLSILLTLAILALLVLLAWFYYKKRREHIEHIHQRDWLSKRLPATRQRADFYWQQLLALDNLRKEFFLNPSLTELEIAELLNQAAMQVNKSAAPPVQAPQLVKPVQAIETPADADALYRPLTDAEDAELLAAEQSALDVLATPLPEVGRPAEDWRPLAQIVAEARYRGKDMAEDRIVPLAEAFDRSEQKLVTELGQAAYLRKRVLPPDQGKITT